MMSRDLDSRYSAREEAAVAEWLRSRAVIHVMRPGGIFCRENRVLGKPSLKKKS